MNINLSTLNDLIKEEWDYPSIDNSSKWTQLVLKSANADVSGGVIKKSDIDVLANHPDVKSVTITGLSQDTFEYFINTYGKQLKFIEFFKNKSVKDWSLLGFLPELEGIYWFHNQKINKMWDMSKNYALKTLVIEDFTQLHDLSGIEKAAALEWFGIGDAVWSKTVVNSFNPLLNTNIRRIDFYGKTIKDLDISIIPEMKKLEVFNFPTNYFTTEQVAWLVAKCPKLKGRSMKPYIEYMMWNENTHKSDIPGVIIVGKRKPALSVPGNESRIENYVSKFNEMVKMYKLIPNKCNQENNY